MKRVYYLFPIVFLELLFVFSFALKVQADSNYQQSIPSLPEPMPKRPPTPLTSANVGASSSAKPLNWESPYWLNNTICRESQGNIICLGSEEAKRLGWFIPRNSQ